MVNGLVTAMCDTQNYITKAPVLAFVDFDQEFVLQTDTSTRGLGAVLYQYQDGHRKVIAYASRTASHAGRNQVC